MAANSNISDSGGAPQVTVRGRNLVRYACHFLLWKPVGQTWPDTGLRSKEIKLITINANNQAGTFSLGAPEAPRGLYLSWQIDMTLPGGVGGPLQYYVTVEVKQDGADVMVPAWEGDGEIGNDPETLSSGTRLKVS